MNKSSAIVDRAIAANGAIVCLSRSVYRLVRSISPWRHARKLPELLAQMAVIVEATLQRNGVTYRDIGRNPVPHVDEAWIAAAYVPNPADAQPNEAIRISDQLVTEFLAADLYVLGVPMYNFSIPSTLKAYIDQIVRPGRTFAFDHINPTNRYEPLVLGKKMVIITARGDSGFGPGEHNETMNHQDPYLRTIFGFMGITDVTFTAVENDEFGGVSLAQSIAAARHRIMQLVGA